MWFETGKKKIYLMNIHLKVLDHLGGSFAEINKTEFYSDKINLLYKNPAGDR